MATFTTEQLRTVVLVSHSGAGKTSIGESLLMAAGSITRLGRTEDGTTTGDYEPEAIKRTSSTQLSILPCVWNGNKVTVLDTPGYFDFLGDAISAMRVADAAILVVSANGKVEVGTEQMWKEIRRLNLPCIIVVNKMDRENSNFLDTVKTLKSSLARECFALQIPIGEDANFKGVIDLLFRSEDVPSDLVTTFDQAKEDLIETIAETDDELATKWLEEGILSDEDLQEPLKQAIANGKAVPVLAASATKNVGCQELLETIVKLIPSPDKSQRLDNGEITLDSNGPLTAFSFKTTADSYVGKLTFLKVYSGTLKSNSEVFNSNRSQVEKIGQLFVPMGKTQQQVPSLTAGEIGAVGRLVVTNTGDTLSSNKETARGLPEITFPDPIYKMAVYPKTKADTDKMGTALTRLSEEDPSLSFFRDQSTGESLLSGLGDAHLDVAVQRALRKFGVNLLLQTPRVPYKETIANTTKVEHRYKQQSGGHGHFAHVMLRIEPSNDESQGLFATEVVGGAVPKDFIPAVEKGVRRAWAEGILAGFPVVDTKAVLYDGSFHPVDSATADFETCGYQAMKKAFTEGSAQLLEPIMLLRVETPDSFTGELIGDLNSKRGRILGMTPYGDGNSLLEGNVPMSEVQRYALDLRSMTQGRASFTMEIDHYDPVPSNLAQKVINGLKEERGAVRA